MHLPPCTWQPAALQHNGSYWQLPALSLVLLQAQKLAQVQRYLQDVSSSSMSRS
jgi:hypothetical protein